MKIAVLGTGMVGQILAGKFVSLGHQVMIGTRNPEETMARTDPDPFGRPPFKDWHTENSRVLLGNFSEAASFGEFIVNATSGSGAFPALRSAGKANLDRKVLLDVSNPLDFSRGMPPSLTVCNDDSLGEQIQREFPEARVVKSLNTLNAHIMINPGALPEETHIFLNGNETSAKKEVRKLLNSFGWKDDCIIDMGDISNARGTEMLVPMWARLYGTFQNPIFNFRIVMGEPPEA
jgi:predicted dinucleotide-binding enzyme